MANRIWHASSFIANAIENDYKVFHLYLDDYVPFFTESLGMHNSPLAHINEKVSNQVKLLRRVFNLAVKFSRKTGWKNFLFFETLLYETFSQHVERFDLNNKSFIQKARSKNLVVSGWLFRDMENLKKHKDKLVAIWTPNHVFMERVNSFNRKYRERVDILIGVHIRRGDYKTFNNGSWYYEISDYHNKMKELVGLQEFSGKRVGFVICSDEENLMLPVSHDFEIFYEKRHFIEDLYLLAKCDYIIGPPSTFSRWASYYGNVPLYMWREKEMTISDDAFKTNLAVF